MLDVEKEIENIFFEKSFPILEKELLKKTLLLIDECYQEQLAGEKESYVRRYIDIVKNLKGCAVIQLEELNDLFEIAEIFKKGIRKQEKGNLEYKNGLYLPKKDGNYVATFTGFAWNKEKMIFLLDEKNTLKLLLTCYHELSHLQEGCYPFFLPLDFPLRNVLLKMFSEGRVGLKEEILNIERPYYLEQIEDDECLLSIKAVHHYPLYSLLYQFLTLIFDYQVLEKLSSNNDINLDMRKELKINFKQIPVDKIFGYLLYLLSCYHRISKKTLLLYLTRQSCDLSILSTVKDASILKAIIFLEQLAIKLSREDLGKKVHLEKLQDNYFIERKECLYILSGNKNKELLKRK